MPKLSPDSQDNTKILLLQLGKGVLLLALLIIALVIFPRTSVLSDPKMFNALNFIFPATVTFNTTSIDRGVDISIGENHTESGIKSLYYYSLDDFVIGITNYHNYPVNVQGTCTYFDQNGKQISATSFPANFPYYYLPAGEKDNYRFLLSLTQSHDIPADPASNFMSNQSSRNIGVITCSIQNVSQASTTG